MSIPAGKARKNLLRLIQQVNDDRVPVEITSRNGDAVLISKAEYDALEETAHLLRSPANAKRLMEGLEQARSGQREEHPPIREARLHPTGWEDYLHWQATDRAMVKRINRLIEDMLRDPFSGIGKPELTRVGAAR